MARSPISLAPPPSSGGCGTTNRERSFSSTTPAPVLHLVAVVLSDQLADERVVGVQSHRHRVRDGSTASQTEPPQRGNFFQKK